MVINCNLKKISKLSKTIVHLCKECNLDISKHVDVGKFSIYYDKLHDGGYYLKVETSGVSVRILRDKFHNIEFAADHALPVRVNVADFLTSAVKALTVRSVGGQDND